MILGPKGSPYEGGCYHGKVRAPTLSPPPGRCVALSAAMARWLRQINFPADYPFKPPGIRMLTPNGRFKVNTKLCLSMSDFHPETWNPLWAVSSVLTGLYTFWSAAPNNQLPSLRLSSFLFSPLRDSLLPAIPSLGASPPLPRARSSSPQARGGRYSRLDHRHSGPEAAVCDPVLGVQQARRRLRGAFPRSG